MTEIRNRHYSDYLVVPQTFSAVMTREAIDVAPDKWLEFYPHEKYVEFLDSFLESLERNSTKPLWLWGNFGTGKSFASLVTQKLLMDDEERVRRWFQDRRNGGADLPASLEEKLFKWRGKVLVVYDYNASGIDPNEGFLVRLEQTVAKALRTAGMIVPPKGTIETIVERLKRYEDNFCTIRDSQKSETFSCIFTQLRSVSELIGKLQGDDVEETAYLLNDVQKFLHLDNVYLNLDASSFKDWIASICKVNNLKRVAYLFDEFSDFLEAHHTQLKTFEDVAEHPELSLFSFVPVTHRSYKAFAAEENGGPRRSTGRFNFRKLEMPENTALQLTASALQVVNDEQLKEKWEDERTALWNSIKGVAQKLSSEKIEEKSFYRILPIHPMSAFLLKFLSESVGANQRSVFEYLKGDSKHGNEFQNFLCEGGPDVSGKQLLTVDYLWKYFLERDDLGQNKEISDIRLEYNKTICGALRDKTERDEEVRVFKAVLLFVLLSRLNIEGNNYLQPTADNLTLAFQGDGVISGSVEGILRQLEKKNCFSRTSDGRIELYSTNVGGAELTKKIDEYQNKFEEFLAPVVKRELEDKTKLSVSQFSRERFKIIVTDEAHTISSKIQSATREKFCRDQNNDDGSVGLWFVIAKNKDEREKIDERVETLLNNFRGLRIVVFRFPSETFCKEDGSLWDKYVEIRAKYALESSADFKEIFRGNYERIEKNFCDRLKKSNDQEIVASYFDEKTQTIVQYTLHWDSEFKKFLTGYVDATLPSCVDRLEPPPTAFSISGFKSWADAGIKFDGSGPYMQLINVLKNKGVSEADDWFAQNPKHPFSQIHSLLEKKLQNTLGKGGNFSLRKAYIELQRAPYGLRKCGLTAFALGFALKGILKKGYQWTNEQQSGQLDSETLTEIIDSVVKDDGDNKIKAEKQICKLSKEEKTFISKAPAIFGLRAPDSGKLEDALLQIQERVGKIADRVPLWVLHEYVRSRNDERADAIEQLFSNFCLAGRTSSKGKVDKRSDAIKAIGKAILDDPGLVEATTKYVTPQNFREAFRIYVDRIKPEFGELANEVGDKSWRYIEAILKKISSDASMIWQDGDFEKEIDEAFVEYETLRLFAPLKLVTGVNFTEFTEVRERVRNDVKQTGVPRTILDEAYPVLSVFWRGVFDNEVYSFKQALEQSRDLIAKLFYDGQKTEALRLLRSKLGPIEIDDDSLTSILKQMSNGFEMDETSYIDAVRAKINEWAKTSVVRRLKEAWQNLTGAETPDEWSKNCRVPARFVFEDQSQAVELIKAIERPEEYATPKLEEFLEILQRSKIVDLTQSRKIFQRFVLGDRYQKFNLQFGNLCKFLEDRYGKQPNEWPVKPDVAEFIQQEYKKTIAPQVVTRIEETPADELKKKIIKFARDNQELGLMFLD